MIFNVELLAFGQGKIRPVSIDDEEVYQLKQDGLDALLESIFHYGQNDFQPLEFPSVSVGDVIHIVDLFDKIPEKHLVCLTGFKKLSEEKYLAWKANPNVIGSYDLLG